ncbi:MAG: hypothetical protein H0U13_09705 [Gemmatimonadaceae bacterium]|nr:hypothetical protein [Gemmatimonadaceae bacterium]
MIGSLGLEPPDAELQAEAAIVRSAAYLFAPLDKRAFGTAIGFVSAIGVFAATAIAAAVAPDNSPLRLLAAYFAGYSVSVAGAFIGAGWAFATGFVAGWFVAFVRNLVLATSLFILRRRVELADSRDFLDHI